MTNQITELRTANGWSQAQLAGILNISRQTVIALEQSKTDPSLSLALRVAWLFRKPIEDIFHADLDEQMTVLNEAWEFKRKSATAFNELGILEEMGREGWELTGFGAGSLHFRRPESALLRRPWLYNRTNGMLATSERTALEQAGWTFCGSWVGVFHYFKREERSLSIS